MRPVPLGGLVTQRGAIMPKGVFVTSFGGGLLIITIFFYSYADIFKKKCDDN
jgi:hypothetical protein